MRLSLPAKISISIVGVLALAILSTIVAIGSAYRFEAFLTTLVEENLESVRAAEELEIALLEQRGYVSSYILDGGNQKWLDHLDGPRDDFDFWLARARETARSDEELEILGRLEMVQDAYSNARDKVVQLYDDGYELPAREALLGDVADRYRQAYDLCEAFIAVNQRLVDAATADVRNQVEQITVIVTVMLLVTVGLGLALLGLFFRGVIMPLRRIAADVRSATGEERQATGSSSADELRELGHYVKLLMTDVAETRSDLEHSRTQLAHADKLAAVGKLAASVAHEIRNPLTSIKMWLYSLRRSLGQDGDSRDKFDIVSDEIARLENIVRNFLEFSRPLKLSPQALAIGPLVDKSLELVRHRLVDGGITLVRQDAPHLPPVLADSEQLRQVFLNLINNAIEAMPGGGELAVSCAPVHHGGREMLAVHVADTGTGIPADVQQHIFEPFYSTKEEGTGLGLCIAASVMARHHGQLELETSTPEGTLWTVWIPTAEAAVVGEKGIGNKGTREQGNRN